MALAPLAAAPALQAQTPAKAARIGVLVHGQPVKAHADALREGLANLGYVEGRNLDIEWQWADGRGRLEAAALDLLRRKIDVIVTAGTPAARAARQATDTVPIVMAVSGDPVGAGLVASFARPGGNITGFSSLAHGVVAKQIELLREAFPKTLRVAILFNPDNAAHNGQVAEGGSTAREFKVELQAVAARNVADFDKAIEEATNQRADGLIVLADLFFAAHAARLADLTARHRLPAIYALSEHVDAGGLMAYGTSRRDLYRRAAILVDRILRGVKPADLPIEQATTFEFVVNSRTAKTLGLTFPGSLLLRADRIVE